MITTAPSASPMTSRPWPANCSRSPSTASSTARGGLGVVIAGDRHEVEPLMDLDEVLIADNLVVVAVLHGEDEVHRDLLDALVDRSLLDLQTGVLALRQGHLGVVHSDRDVLGLVVVRSVLRVRLRLLGYGHGRAFL